MRCLCCSREIPAAFLVAWSASAEAKSGRFGCPRCDADHVRREIAPLPSGQRQFAYPLWGHLTAIRQKEAKDAGGWGDRHT
jgi:hypothetical protein